MSNTFSGGGAATTEHGGITATPRKNRACGATDHWAYKCPELSTDQQAQLNMHIEAEGENPEVQGKGHQLLNVSMMQGEALPDNQASLDGCSTITAFKTEKFLSGIKTMDHKIKVNCNAGAVVTNKVGSFQRLNVWYIPSGIANILSMHELEKHYRITYDIWEGHYVIHITRGGVKFYKDEQG